MQNIRTLFAMIKQLMFIMNKKQKRNFVFLMLSSIVVAIFETLGVGVIIPFILVMLSPEEFMQNQYVQIIVQWLHITDYFQLLLLTAIGIVLIYFIKTVVVITISYFQTKYRNELERDLSIKMLTAYIHQNYLFHVNTNSSEIVRGVQSDIAGVASVIDNFNGLLCEGLSAALIGVFLISLNPSMAIILLLLAGATSMGVVLIFKKRTNICGEKTREAFQRKVQYIQQSENGIKDIIVTKRYDFFINKFKKYSMQACKYNTEYLCIYKIPSRVVELTFITGLVITSVFCMNRDGDATMLVTMLGTFAVAAVRILPSISNLATYMNGLIYNRHALEAAHRNLSVGVASAKIVSNSSTIDKDNVKFENGIQIKNINWKYNEKLDYVLENVSFNIQKGEAVALIGPSGAGKTTMADILLGLLIPEEGEVLVDDWNIFEYPEQWSSLVSYVPQTLFLIDDTIRNNIAFGIPEEEIDDEQIWNVLKEAQLKEIVETLPDGLDTNLGEQGLKISGGQRQRIAIARALYSNPEVLILDEATSALDTDTEMAVMESIDALHGKKTLIIIAHRLSTIKMCDKIYEIKDGHALLRVKEEVLHER